MVSRRMRTCETDKPCSRMGGGGGGGCFHEEGNFNHADNPEGENMRQINHTEGWHSPVGCGGGGGGGGEKGRSDTMIRK